MSGGRVTLSLPPEDSHTKACASFIINHQPVDQLINDRKQTEPNFKKQAKFSRIKNKQVSGHTLSIHHHCVSTEAGAVIRYDTFYCSNSSCQP